MNVPAEVMAKTAPRSSAREALLARVLWGVAAGSSVEVRPGGVVSYVEAVEHARAHAGPAAARRIVALPALREQNIRPVPPLRA